MKILALVLRVEVNKRVGVCSVDPDSAEDACVDGAHQPLADDVETVR